MPSHSIIKFCKLFDVVIFMPDLHFLNYCFLPFFSKKSKIISWSIGIRASYKLRYDISRKKKLLDYILLIVLRRCDANIFYYDMPKLFWGRLLKNEKIFIAPNTVFVDENHKSTSEKKYLLFLGSLVEGKGLFDLVEVMKDLYFSGFNLPLKIVGGGPLKPDLIDRIRDYNLINFILIEGPIYSESKLKSIFSGAICLLSPRQAGLSVLKSMGYGVPVVSNINSITGGELYNINKDNGFLYQTNAELKEIINKCQSNPELFISKGIEAKKFYLKNRTLRKMTVGFDEAIKYVLNTKL